MREHLRNVQLGWAGFGWFIAVALTGVQIVALSALDLIRPDAPVANSLVAIALAIGFLVASFYMGTRVAAAPVMNGVLMALFSLIAWFLLNLFLGEPTGVTAWTTLSLGSASLLLALQVVASILGARAGVRWANR